jgi:type II secretory pathway pseudopilin PulG
MLVQPAPRKRLRPRGVTAVDVMNFLGLAAILSALAMYGVARYVRHAKTAEAIGATSAMAQQAAAYYNESDAHQPAGTKRESARAMRHFPPSSRASVPASPTDVRGKRYQSAMGDWAPSPWPELRFSLNQPQSYAYSFDSTGSGPTARATATAQGDLDGNGAVSTYASSVIPDDALDAKVSPEVVRLEPEE